MKLRQLKNLKTFQLGKNEITMAAKNEINLLKYRLLHEKNRPKKLIDMINDLTLDIYKISNEIENTQTHLDFLLISQKENRKKLNKLREQLIREDM